MTREISARLNLLVDMNIYIRDIIGDDDLTHAWDMYGVPDEADIDMMIEIAEDKRLFIEIVEQFSNMIDDIHR